MTHIDTLSRRILVVEDSRSMGMVVSNNIQRATGLMVDHALSLGEAVRFLEQAPGRYLLAVTDLNLPDAPNGEVVDEVLARDIAVIVMTGQLSEELRRTINRRPIVDYVLKRNASSIEYLTNLALRITRNENIKALVVDDSQSYRAYLAGLLRIHRYQVLEAEDGQAALWQIARHPDISLVITDYQMPGMDGAALTEAIRTNMPRSKTCIIGISSTCDSSLTARFLKSGANDTLPKPVQVEEFYSRVTNHMDVLDYIAQVEESAYRDYLTKLHNRRYLFDAGERLFASACRNQVSLAIAMLDIDFFKRINDTHGHAVGDRALIHVAQLLMRSLRKTDILARLGGEEFCVLTVNTQDPSTLFDRIRAELAAMEIPLIENQVLRMTISIGVNLNLGATLDQTISRADQALYEAKHTGRNRVVVVGA
ncbi:two-component system, cell cycle response regulator [Gammaproteobacteria bacterium]